MVISNRSGLSKLPAGFPCGLYHYCDERKWWTMAQFGVKKKKKKKQTKLYYKRLYLSIRLCVHFGSMFGHPGLSSKISNYALKKELPFEGWNNFKTNSPFTFKKKNSCKNWNFNLISNCPKFWPGGVRT